MRQRLHRILLCALVLLGMQTWAAPSGGETAAGYYNQANAYARAGKLGLAVVNYERANLLSANDADVAENLRLVREAAKVADVPVSWFERAASSMSPGWFAGLGLLGIFCLGVSLLAGFFLPGIGQWRIAGAVIGMALFGATVCNAVVLWPKLHAAVVISNATPVRVTPAPMGDQVFVLPEAETITVTAEHEDFVLIETRAGRTGWVSRSDLAMVVPVRAAR